MGERIRRYACLALATIAIGIVQIAAPMQTAAQAGQRQVLSAIQVSPNETAGHFYHRSITFLVNDRKTTIEDFYLARSRASQLRVFDLVSLQGTPVARTYGLAEAARALHPFILIDAGSAGTVAGIPKSIGLISAGGRVVFPLSNPKLYGTGIVCISQNGAVSIIWASNYKESLCWNAVQSGPLVINPGGAIGINPRTLREPSYHFSVFVLDRDGVTHLMWTSAAHLYDVAMFLHQGKGVFAAINLGTDGGIIANDPPVVISFGEGDKPVAASIGLTP